MVKIPVVHDITPEEEAKIRRQIAADPDTWEASPDKPIIKRKP